MGKLPATKQDGHLDLVAVLEKLHGPFGLGVEVVVADFRPEPDLLDLDVLLILASLALFLGLFVLETAVIEQAADGGNDVGRDFYEIEVLGLGQLQCLKSGHDAELLAVFTNQSDLTYADPIVHTEIGFANRLTPWSLLRKSIRASRVTVKFRSSHQRWRSA